jgi:hypothetical protein
MSAVTTTAGRLARMLTCCATLTSFDLAAADAVCEQRDEDQNQGVDTVGDDDRGEESCERLAQEELRAANWRREHREPYQTASFTELQQPMSQFGATLSHNTAIVAHMNLESYVDDLRRELLVAAEAGGEDARALAERLLAPLDSAARLVLLEALSAAADEITRDLAPGTVEVRLRGRNPSFVVTPAPDEETFDDKPDVSAPARIDADEGGTSRINLRLPDALKLRAEEAAGREGLSVNAWLVRAVAAVLEPDDRDGHARRHSPRGRQHYTGWVR